MSQSSVLEELKPVGEEDTFVLEEGQNIRCAQERCTCFSLGWEQLITEFLEPRIYLII